MKFTANTTDLQRTLVKLGGVLPTRSSMPILENILFDLRGNILTLTGTDISVSLMVSMSVNGVEDGKIAIPAKRIVETIRSLPDMNASFTIDTTTSRVTLVTPNGRYNLNGEAAKDYPQIAVVQGADAITINNESLKKIIYRTVFAVSSDELRPAMMGVLFQSKANEFRAVSTDGHRLVKLVHTGLGRVHLAKDIIVPAKALTILGRSIESGETKLSVNDTHVQFTFNGSTLVSRLIEEAYPNYESVIPGENDKMLTVNREEMISSIRRVALYASATTHQVRLMVSADAVEVSAQDVDFGGEAKETLRGSFSGGDLEIGFNATYLTDILAHLDSEMVEFRFSMPTRAAIVRPGITVEGEDVVMLVMPVRLNS